MPTSSNQIFPKWVNKTPLILAGSLPLVTVGLIGAVWYYFSPKFKDVGYAPKQPVPYSHKLHAGELGLDCRYCHFSVETNAKANVPPTQVCMNCHKNVKTESPALAPVRESWEKDTPVEWIKVHKIPDHAQFTHAPHMNAGVGCVSCHGRIDQMPVVSLQEPLSMSWCLDCHRDPAPHLRPKALITKMDWEPTDADKKNAEALAATLKAPTHCSGCHR